MNRRDILQLSTDEIARLVALNLRLIEMEYWIFKRVQRLAEDHRKSFSGKDAEEYFEDFEIDCTVHYRGPEKEDSDNYLLTCSFAFANSLKHFFTRNDYDPTGDSIREYFQFNWYDGITEIEALASQRICWSFHDLHDHHNLTWTDILQIEGVWVDVRAISQWITRFPELITGGRRN